MGGGREGRYKTYVVGKAKGARSLNKDKGEGFVKNEEIRTTLRGVFYRRGKGDKKCKEMERGTD